MTVVVSAWLRGRVRAFFAVQLVLLAVVGFACSDGGSDESPQSESTTTRSSPPAMTVAKGELVRGTNVTVGYAGVGSTTVTRAGTATITFRVPNALSGEDDVIPLDPGTSYVLEVGPRNRTSGAADRISFEVAAARQAVPYSVVARRGPRECGAPPLEIDFDGVLWTPPDRTGLSEEKSSFDGSFTLGSDTAGRFVASDGTEVSFVRAASGYSC